jgi:phosphatidylglycerol:prolipoprotein diacylglycerol transferase
MFPIIQIGPLAIQTPGLFLFLAIWLGLILSERYAARHSVTADTLSSLVLIVLTAGVIGARIGYIARYFSAFRANPLGVFSLNTGLFDQWSGYAIGGLAGFIYGRRHGLRLGQTLDALTPLFVMLFIGIGFAHLASGDAFGAQTSIPWAIELWGAHRHPSQIYEILTGLIPVGLLWIPPAFHFHEGTLFLRFTAITAASRLFLEAFRGDSVLILGGIREAQLVAWLVLASALWGLDRLGTVSIDKKQQ